MTLSDPRTKAALRELAAEGHCTCIHCVEARIKGITKMPQCEINRRAQELQDMIIPPNPSNFFPELSPQYNPKTGMLETDSSRPVGMISTDSTNTGRIATKWIIKD